MITISTKCDTSLRHIMITISTKCDSYIVAVSFVGGGNPRL
jgi:hypothetical protein